MSDDMKTFLCEYPFAGSRWGFEIKATDQAEAEARLKAIGWGEVCGELKMKIPAVAPNWLMSCVIWVANKIA